jgi:GNAT superfamily N-acetyltransferase
VTGPHDWTRDGFRISTAPGRLDLDVIHGFLWNSYWAAGIPREVVERSIRGSLCFGLYRESGGQIGFARVITDRATFAHLADVFVREPWRGRGLSKWLLETILAHPELQGLRRFSLGTKDAHTLYARFGFMALEEPSRWMEILRPDVYRSGPADPLPTERLSREI